MPAPSDDFSLDFHSLAVAYEERLLSPSAVIESVFRRIERAPAGATWIHLLPRAEVLAAAAAVERRRAAGERLPLFGLPFGVKDSIDVAGVPTTAACPAYAYTPARSAAVVRNLLAAGALLVGKTNLDQFATGLVGVRSPYGIPENPFDPKVIPGGSSSGSAVAVATGHVSFTLGTDTAGSGRVPAALNNVVGLKPSRGLLSTAGLVPACRSLDCISVFALTVDDAGAVADAAKGYDPEDALSRPEGDTVRLSPGPFPEGFRFGVPREGDREFFGDAQARDLFAGAIERMQQLGGQPVEIDLAPFLEAGRLLYGGPWVAERLSAFERFLRDHEGDVLPVIRQILDDGRRYDAIATFRALDRLAELRRAVGGEWRRMDVLVVPTMPTVYTIAEVLADPRRLNTHLGYYTNFGNLLDLAAISVPTGLRRDGVPAGLMLVGPRDKDSVLGAIGAAYHRRAVTVLGATRHPVPAPLPRSGHSPESMARPSTGVRLAVVGAHLRDQPLNPQLLEAGARLVRSCRTAPVYRLFLVPGASPPKPGMVRVEEGRGVAMAIEIWEVPSAALGAFVAKVPSPLCIGSVLVEDGESVLGFLCEPFALTGAPDISHHGGWRAYLAEAAQQR